MNNIYDLAEESKNSIKVLKEKIIESAYLAENLGDGLDETYNKNLSLLILRYLKLIGRVNAIQSIANNKSKLYKSTIKEVDVFQLNSIINTLKKEYAAKFDIEYLKR